MLVGMGKRLMVCLSARLHMLIKKLYIIFVYFFICLERVAAYKTPVWQTSLGHFLGKDGESEIVD
jgi:hypothetical protein